MTVKKNQVENSERINQASRKSRERRRLFSFVSFILLFVLGGVREANPSEPGIPEPTEIEHPARESQATEDRSATVSGKVETGETFYDLMKSSETSNVEILAMAKAARKVFSLRKIKTGQPYEIRLDLNGEPETFRYEIDDHRIFVLNRKPDGWTAGVVLIEYEMRERVVEGSIQDSLYLSLVDACQPAVLAADLADVFAWDIDFALDLRYGDTYSILYEERWRDGRYAGPGRILAARMVSRGEVYTAVYYKDATGEEDYYDSDGRSLQKQFLKSPLRFKYISSSFSTNRVHPVLKIRAPHLGVDYAAPYGTPVRAAANGRVVSIGRNGGMGKMIKIRHTGIYATVYGHLSGYATGLNVGKQVKQGEIIGYVGSTGLSTGPHLHYAFYKNGKLINPMKEQNPRAKSIPPSEFDRFKTSARWLLERIQPQDSEKGSVSADGGRL
jgi:murein DD-endopeptidase MepM/ murein hydrolase activator NlpD